jgi:hypothetical protein
MLVARALREAKIPCGKTPANCEILHQPAARKRLYDLLAGAIANAKSAARPDDLLDALYDDYKEFSRMKRRQEWPKLGS